MDIQCAYDEIDKDTDLIGVGITENALIVSNQTKRVTFTVPFETVKNNSWGELYEVLSCKRDSTPIEHMSRIVGYFSRISNWNSSKIEELNDRHNGNYLL